MALRPGTGRFSKVISLAELLRRLPIVGGALNGSGPPPYGPGDMDRWTWLGLKTGGGPAMEEPFRGAGEAPRAP